jgi:uncharacterized protein GlcG (DUF336 family)
LKLKTTLTLDLADAITAEVFDLAASHKLLPLTVAVLDVGGNPVVLKRQDGSGILRADIAIGKAWGALGMGMASRVIRDRLADRPAFQNALAAASKGRFIPVPGGVQIFNAEMAVIGAVGVSGDASDKDEFCAIEAIKAVGLTPDPAEPNPDWQKAGL